MTSSLPFLKSKSMNQDTIKKLSSYSSISASFIFLCSHANSQIIYTDPPDIILTPGMAYNLDLNNDGLVELKFIHYPGDKLYISNLQPYPTSGEWVEWVGYPFWLYNQPPIPLKANKAVQASLTPDKFWVDGGFDNDALLCSFINSNAILWRGVHDKYIGFRFAPFGQSDHFHYGWIRLNVSTSCAVRIKDWAYNSELDEAIYTGQTMRLENGQMSEDVESLKTLLVYANDHLIWIKNNSNQLSMEISVFNTMGQRMYTMNSSAVETSVGTQNLSPGIYIVKVVANDQVMSHKILIQ